MTDFPFKLGANPSPPDGRDIKLKAILGGSLPTPPKRFGYGTITPNWGMLGNDRYGDCVFAGIAHQVMGFNKTGPKTNVEFTPTSVLSDYSAVTGFNANDPNSDQGTDPRSAAKYWQKTGVVDANGTRHKIGAYAWLTPGDYAEYMTACFLFEFVGVAATLQQAQMDQFYAGKVWDVVEGSPEIGGHYFVGTGRIDTQDNGILTWAERRGMTQRFYEQQNVETLVVVTEEELSKGVNRRGVSLANLNQYLQEV